MALRARVQALVRHSRFAYAARWSNGGRDHDSSGSIRAAGGAFSKKEKAQEDQYFRNLELEQLKKLNEHYEEEIDSHEDAIEDLEKQIQRHKDKIRRHKKLMLPDD